LPVDFDYLWREALLDLPVEDGALVTPGGMRIHTVILPPVSTQENLVPERLDELITLGVRVIFLNSAPSVLVGKGEVCPTVNKLDGFIRPDVVVNGNAQLTVARRQDGSRQLFAFLHEDTEACEATISFPGDGLLQRFDYAREAWVDLDGSSAHVKLAGMQSAVFSKGGEPTGIREQAVGDALSTVTGWTAITPEGKRIELKDGLADWRSFYPADYTGWMTYQAELEVPAAGKYRVNLGRVCWAARVTIGDNTQLAAFAPYAADFDLPAGTHRITVEVLNTPANSTVGTPEAESQVFGGVRAWIFTQIGNDRNYLTSGLLGPVTVHTVE
jgi:hypothetical protein